MPGCEERVSGLRGAIGDSEDPAVKFHPAEDAFCRSSRAAADACGVGGYPRPVHACVNAQTSVSSAPPVEPMCGTVGGWALGVRAVEQTVVPWFLVGERGPEDRAPERLGRSEESGVVEQVCGRNPVGEVGGDCSEVGAIVRVGPSVCSVANGLRTGPSVRVIVDVQSSAAAIERNGGVACVCLRVDGPLGTCVGVVRRNVRSHVGACDVSVRVCDVLPQQSPDQEPIGGLGSQLSREVVCNRADTPSED